MKINRLSFENINSLAGKWEIDFGDPAFSEGIFILAGPTGAGKTSILDAICLGLYGLTSRQRTFTARENEVMTKGTFSCFAQVEFESRDRRYRSYWEHRRKRGGGEFQNKVVRKMYDITDHEERSLAEGITETAKETADILKMDFRQFTSAVLLPQGRFDEFLNADKKLRSEILERITGSRIYSRIGIAVQKRKTAEETALKILKEKAETLPVFTAEEKEAAERELAGQRNLEAEKSEAAAEGSRLLFQCRRFEKLRREIEDLEEELAELRAEERARADDFTGLERAKKAAALFSLVAAYEQCERERNALEEERTGIENALQAIAEEERKLAPALDTAETERRQTFEACRGAEPLIRRVRGLAVDLRLKQHSRDQKNGERTGAERAGAEHAKSLAEQDKQFRAVSLDLMALEDILGKTGLEQASLLEKIKNLEDRIRALSTFSSALSFDGERKKLQDGEACPLCGAREHPFCRDMGEVEKQAALCRELGEEKDRAERELREYETACEDLENKKNAAEKNQALTEERRNILNAALEEDRRRLEGLEGELEGLEEGIEETKAALEACFFDLAVFAQHRFQAASGMLSAPGSPAGGEDVDSLEREVQAALDRAEAELAALRKKSEALEAGRAVHEKNLADKAGREKSLAEEARQKKLNLEAGFTAAGFEDHEAWRRCFWETGKILEVERRKTELTVRIAAGETALAAKKEEAAVLPPLPVGTATQLEQNLMGLQDEVQRLNQSIGEISSRLAENEKRKRQREEMEKEIALRSETCRRWKQMDDWIGGGGGFRFKQFAQTITFRQLVYNARPYLLRMSAGRYELRSQTGDEELLPLVIDRHQGSIERVVSNLSGGERFLLSLSLALGLSKLNSGNLQIDSLFLDEGFGTLDKETLDLAINVLGGLQQNQGKLTGIISHVEELQERLGAVIRVSKSGGGRSTISGCGVRRL